MSSIKKRTFVWQFDSPVEDIWPVLADTARLNEAAGFPKHDIEEVEQPDGSLLFMATAQIGPFTIIWEDRPQNWVSGKWLRHGRYFENGPLKTMIGGFVVEPNDAGCRVEFTVEAEPRNLLGRLILSTAFFSGAEKTYGRLADNAREFAAGRSEREYEMPPVKLMAGVADKIKELSAQLDATDFGHGLAARLADFITTRPEVDCATIRPLRLARLWQVPSRLAIEACLQAAKLGLLGSRWDLLCPRCQVGKETVDNLASMPQGTHCPSCNIDYERDYTKNLELAFYPSRSIRPIDHGEYCLFGPMGTPHIKIQLSLEPGTDREEIAEMEHGTYRFRTLQPGPECVIDWREDGAPLVTADGETITVAPGAPAGKIRFVNHTSRRLVFVVEEYAWKRDVLTAHQATTMQAFRELFDEEVLRPGDNVEIDSVTIMFTDFKGSTAMYERLGDSQAYYLIRQFFAVLGKAIRENNGTIVKTIGDAVNAAFSSPADALACAIEIQKSVEVFNRESEKEPITVTIGAHVGRCISVTLNDQLDYYGTAANKAARLESQSDGGDLVLSQEFCADPTVREMLENFELVPETAVLKGFDDPVDYFKITADEMVRKRVPG